MKKVFALMLMLAAMLIGGTRIATAAENQETTTATVTNGNYRLQANSYHRHQIFLTQGTTWIMVDGDGDTDLDVYVYDESNNLVAKSESNSDVEFVGLTVHRGGYFNVKVINRGIVYNDYTFLVRENRSPRNKISPPRPASTTRARG